MNAQTFADVGIEIPAGRSGQVNLPCPQCGPTRKHPRKQSLSVNTDEGAWMCHHPGCDFTGRLEGSEPAPRSGPLAPREPLAYTIPAPPPEGVLPDGVLRWFAERGIPERVLTAAHISYGQEWCPQTGRKEPTIRFPYYRDGQLVNIKYRALPKYFWMVKGAERILYGHDDITGAETVVIVEGEIDKLAVMTAGGPPCASVPNGAPDLKAKNYASHFAFLDGAAEEHLQGAKTILIGTDMDDAGQKCAEELARRLGSHKCARVSWPAGCKDANETLIKHGPEGMLAALAEAEPYPSSPAEDSTTSADDSDEDGDASRVLAASSQLARDDFVAHLEAHKYLCRLTRKLWPRAGVDAAVPPVLDGIDADGNPVWVRASDWLDEHAPVHQITWSPGDPELIVGRVLNQGGWLVRDELRAYNLYQPPTLALGDPENAGPWVEHVRLLYPEQADHIITWLAHRVQRPEEKVNHALLLGGGQGIGKDTILRPVREAVGPWNVADASPAQVMGRFNGFLRSVILLIPELCDLGDVDRYSFYEHVKPIIAAPPDTLRCDEKFMTETQILNVTGVVMTSNQRIGIYLPAGDRRHFAAWSEVDPAALPANYFAAFHRWLDAEGGCGHVAAYLHAVDLAGFDPKAPSPKTAWFWSIVDAGRAPEESELATLLDWIATAPAARTIFPQDGEWPHAVTLAQLIACERQRRGGVLEQGDDFASWLEARKNRRQIPHRMEAIGYVPVRNDAAKDGLWKVGGARMVVYARAELARHGQLLAVARIAEGAS